MSMLVPLMTGGALPRDLGIPGSGGNPVSYVQAVGRNNISPIMPNQMPHLGLGPDNLGPIPKILANQKPPASFPSWKKNDLHFS